MQKLKDGRLVPWNWGSKFKDGSLRVDIPIQALNLYFNGVHCLPIHHRPKLIRLQSHILSSPKSIHMCTYSSSLPAVPQASQWLLGTQKV